MTNYLRHKISDRDFILLGDNYTLRKLDVTDISEKYIRWLNDPEVNRYSSRYGRSFSFEDVKDYIEEANSKKSNKLLFGIFQNSNQENHIGNILLGPIDFGNKRAELSNLIGEKEFWGKRVAFECCVMLIHYAFLHLKLNKITIGNISNNRGATFLTKQLGFNQEGRLIDEVFMQGQYFDVLRFGLFENIFYENFPNIKDKEFLRKNYF